uniref:Uncharacterized protein n=1 Tax=viral metagenome TaxID=1070528 RepID=A0A6C0KFC4_9ZZZZ
MATAKPKIVIYFRRNGILENVEITWDSREEMTHISDIRKIVHRHPERFGIMGSNEIDNIILKDLKNHQKPLVDFEKIDRDLHLFLQVKSFPLNGNVFSKVNSFLVENDQFNTRLAQQRKIPELEKGINCIEFRDRVRKYLKTYKEIFRRMNGYYFIDDDYFDDLVERNEEAAENGEDIEIEDSDNVEVFMDNIKERFIDFGILIMEESTHNSRLEKENEFWEKLMIDVDSFRERFEL